MRIEWVNHAGFVVDHAGVRLLCDPWLAGRVFDESWELLSPSRFRPEDFASVTHLWFSHEHPDHFHPPTLRGIPAPVRARQTVLYQPVRNRRVVEFCRSLGFGRVIEPPVGEWFPLTEDLVLRCEPCGSWGDSWVCLRSAEHSLLDLNDCRTDRAAAETIARRVGRVDVLISQFSYAMWTANPEDREQRQCAADRVLEELVAQVEELAPECVIPAASFVRFCHQENVYMNDAANRIDRAVAVLEARTRARPVVLYPGDVWTPGAPHDNAAALERYAVDLRRAEENPELACSRAVGVETLLEASREFVSRLRQLNPTIFLYRLLPARIHVSDLRRTFELSVRHGLRVRAFDVDACDVSLSSSALLYCFRHLWGGASLYVNGRYRVPPRGEHRRFWAFTQLAGRNHRGERHPDLWDRIARLWGRFKLGARGAA